MFQTESDALTVYFHGHFHAQSNLTDTGRCNTKHVITSSELMSHDIIEPGLLCKKKPQQLRCVHTRRQRQRQR